MSEIIEYPVPPAPEVVVEEPPYQVPLPDQSVEFVRYFSATGRIFATCYASVFDAPRQIFSPDQAWLPVDELPKDMEAVYVSGNAVIPRPVNPAQWDGTTLSGIELPAVLWVNRIAYEVPDSTLTLDFPHAGLYKVTLECWPYLDMSMEIVK